MNIPAGTKIWVTIIHEPGGTEKPISGPEDTQVLVDLEGNFTATLRPSMPAYFKPGVYKIKLETHFNSGCQTVDVLRKAGVELDSRGRSSVYTEPTAIPDSPDFKPHDPEFPKAGRYLSVVRDVKLEPPANETPIDSVKHAILVVQGRGRSSMAVEDSVRWFAKAGGFRPISWSSELGSNGKWTVTLECIDGEKQVKAQWSYDPKVKMVKYLDHLAKTLSYVPAD